MPMAVPPDQDLLAPYRVLDVTDERGLLAGKILEGVPESDSDDGETSEAGGFAEGDVAAIAGARRTKRPA